MSRSISLVSYKDGERVVVGTCRLDAQAGLALVSEIVMDPSVPMNQYVMNQMLRNEDN